jgi:hypothetical protein
MLAEAVFDTRWNMERQAGTGIEHSWTGFDPSGDGYDWMEDARHAGFRIIASWGSDGWDMGDWPYVIIAYQRLPDGTYVDLMRIEGDLRAWHHKDHATLTAHLDKLAHSWWSRNDNGPDDLNTDAARGWYNAKRLAERATNG